MAEILHMLSHTFLAGKFALTIDAGEVGYFLPNLGYQTFQIDTLVLEGGEIVFDPQMSLGALAQAENTVDWFLSPNDFEAGAG